MPDAPPPTDRPDAADGEPNPLRASAFPPPEAPERYSSSVPQRPYSAPASPGQFSPPASPGQYPASGYAADSASSNSGVPGPYGPHGGAKPNRAGLSIAALSVGGVALLLALVPIVNFLAIVIALVGVVLAIVALVRKSGGRGLAIAGLIVSAVAVILAIVLAVFYTTQIIESIEASEDISAVEPSPDFDPGLDGSTDPDVDTDGDGLVDGPAEGEEGSRTNPAPIGSTVEFTDLGGSPQWVITPGTPVLDATAQVAQDDINEIAPAGSQFALLPLTVQYVGGDTGFPYDISVTFVSEAGNTYESGDVFATVPPALFDINELYPGAEAAGNVVIAVPSDELATGTWVVSTSSSDSYFFAAQ